ncbi:MAG: glycosyltransferase family 39 protein [Chthoniobacterales bacterium]|nr:glycosyltransferase family 39 protein [Chthoniobacterales bacterium]
MSHTYKKSITVFIKSLPLKLKKREIFLFFFLFLTSLGIWGQRIHSELTPNEAIFRLLALRWEPAYIFGPSGLGILFLFAENLPEFLQKIFSPLAWFLTGIGIWFLAKWFYGKSVAFWPTLAWCVFPAGFQAADSFSTEIFSVAAWIWFWAFFLRALKYDDILDWICASLIATIGVWISYSFWLIYPAFFIFVFFDKFLIKNSSHDNQSSKHDNDYQNVIWHQQMNNFSLSWKSLAVILLPIVFSYPIYQWNSDNDWISFSKTLQARLAFEFSTFLENVGELIILSGGVMFFYLFFIFIEGIINFKINKKEFPLLTIWIVSFVWLILSLWQSEDLLGPTLFFGVPGFLFARNGICQQIISSQHPNLLTKIIQNRFFFYSSLFCSLGIIFYQKNILDLPHTKNWKFLSEELEKIKMEFTDNVNPPPFLIAENAKFASLLSAYLVKNKGHSFPPVFVRESQNIEGQFGLWPRYDEFELTQATSSLNESFAPDHFHELRGTSPYLHQNALYITSESKSELCSVIINSFVKIRLVQTFLFPHGEKIFIYFCENYQPAPL